MMTPHIVSTLFSQKKEPQHLFYSHVRPYATGAYLTPLTIAAGYCRTSSSTSDGTSDHGTSDGTSGHAQRVVYEVVRPFQPAATTCAFLSPVAFMRDPTVGAEYKLDPVDTE
jgi:hypothetical protein